jgi:hypothetical protein
MPIYVKNSGSWGSSRVYVKDSGAWKEPNQIYVKDGGIWKPIYTVVDITSSTQNVDLYALAGSPTDPVTLIVNVADGVIIGSSSTSTPAFNVGSFPAGSIIYLNIGSNAYIVGRGGNGGARVAGRGDNGPSKPGTAGGNALYTRHTTYLTNNGIIGGGGGGGGGGGIGGNNTPGGTAGDGAVNTGSGGGAMGYNSSGGFNTPTGKGGSGIVILRVPTAKYTGTVTGSPTVTTDGSDTVIQFTASGTYTA